MAGGYITDVKRRVTALEAAQRYGLQIRHNKAHCIHGNRDTNASMSFRQSDGICTCWACNGRAVTAVDIAMYQLGLTDPMDAARQIDRDFCLGIWNDSGKQTVQQQQQQPPRIRKQWELERDAKQLIADLNQQKRSLEAQIDAEGANDTLLDSMNKLLQDRSAAEVFLENLRAGGDAV